jgi:predicted RNase H-like nuclease
MSPTLKRFAGVDGFKKGWLIALADEWPPHSLELAHAPTFREVADLTSKCLAVAVDMPIGLPKGDSRRLCDLAARTQLGSAGSSVFPAPPRETLICCDPHHFQDAHRKAAGRGASLPVWGIIQKIREVDEVMTAEKQHRIIEFHPEVTWTRLLLSRPPSKHNAAGLLMRLSHLSIQFPEVFNLAKTDAAVLCKLDDLLDAVVGIAAAIGKHDRLTEPLGSEDQVDAKGLKMQIWP